MRVKVRLTADSFERAIDPPAGFRLHHSGLQSMGFLFVDDPLVTSDDESWYLSSTAIDEGDARMDGTGADVIRETVETINGISKLMLQPGPFNEERVFPYAYEGRLDGPRAMMSGAYLGVVLFDHLDAASAKALLELAAQNDLVQRVLTLLAQAQPDSIWFDWYRIWDVMKSYFPDPANPNLSFKGWVSSLDPMFRDLYYDFENSANDPNHGVNRRHNQRNYTPPFDKLTKRTASVITHGLANAFLKKVIVAWLEYEHGLVIVPQWP